jgi:hypothetical protein
LNIKRIFSRGKKKERNKSMPNILKESFWDVKSVFPSNNLVYKVKGMLA